MEVYARCCLYAQDVGEEDDLGRQSKLSSSHSLHPVLTLFQLFLHFQGPATILVQSRGGRLSDVLTTRDVNEIADSPAGSVQQALMPTPVADAVQVEAPKAKPMTMSYASVNREGSVKFDEQKS